MVQCIKLGREAEGLEKPPLKGPVGQRIFENVSKQAWQMWLGQQTMLMNEYRLSPLDPKARKFLQDEMEKFFFSAESKPPERLMMARVIPTRVISDLMKPAKISRARSVLRERLISTTRENPVKFIADKRRALIP